MKYWLFIAGCCLLSPVFASELPRNTLDTLAAQLSDHYARIVEKSITQNTSANDNTLTVTFELEGFNMGNNVQHYLCRVQKNL